MLMIGPLLRATMQGGILLEMLGAQPPQTLCNLEWAQRQYSNRLRRERKEGMPLRDLAGSIPERGKCIGVDFAQSSA